MDCAKEKVLAKDFMQHYNTEHEDEQPSADHEDGKNKFSIEYDNMANFDYKDYSFWPTKLKATNGSVFFQVDRIMDKIMHFWVYFLGSAEEADNYAYTIFITGKSKEEFTYFGPVIPLDENFMDIIQSHKSFGIGVEAIKRLVDSGLINIEVTIHNLKEDDENDDAESGVSEGFEINPE